MVGPFVRIIYIASTVERYLTSVNMPFAEL